MHKILIFALAMGFVMVAHGHHWIGRTYEDAEAFTMEAVVKSFRFINPHPFIVVEVVEVTGAPEGFGDASGTTWTFEMDNRWELAQYYGFESDTLQPGDRIVVTGFLGVIRPNTMYVQKLVHPESGFTYEHHPR